MKNSFDRLIQHIAEENSSELGNRKINYPNRKAKRKESERKQNRASKNCRAIWNVLTHLNWGGKQGNRYKDVMAKNFPKLMEKPQNTDSRSSENQDR